MPNSESKKKRTQRGRDERAEIRRYTSSIKTYFRRHETAVQAGEADRAEQEHRQLSKLIDKAVKRGALHKNNGARKKARAARVRADRPEQS